MVGAGRAGPARGLFERGRHAVRVRRGAAVIAAAAGHEAGRRVWLDAGQAERAVREEWRGIFVLLLLFLFLFRLAVFAVVVVVLLVLLVVFFVKVKLVLLVHVATAWIFQDEAIAAWSHDSVELGTAVWAARCSAIVVTSRRPMNDAFPVEAVGASSLKRGDWVVGILGVERVLADGALVLHNLGPPQAPPPCSRLPPALANSEPARPKVGFSWPLTAQEAERSQPSLQRFVVCEVEILRRPAHSSDLLLRAQTVRASPPRFEPARRNDSSAGATQENWHS